MSNNTNIKQDIVQQQQKIIAVLRAKNKSLEETNTVVTEENARLLTTITEYEQKIDYLREVQEEYHNLKAAFRTGNVTYNEAMSTVNSARDVELRIQRAQQQADIEAQREQAEEDRKQQILKDNPHILKYFEEQKSKANAAKNMMLEKATAFYNLTDDQLQQYVDISHRPEASAIKHLIDEYTEGGDALGKNQYIVYECNLCDDGRKYYQLRDMERHCYNNGHNHRDANLKRIEDSAREDIADAKREMEKEIFLAAQAKNTATLRAAAESQRAAQAQAKKSLPYVK